MGFMSPDLPDVDPDTWLTLPRATRLQVVTRHWVEHGFGTPYAVYLLYLIKIVLYVAAPAAIISLTPGLGGLSRIGDWWTQPIVYQKFIVFTLLFRGPGLWLRLRPADGAVHATGRWVSLLVAAQHHSTTGLAGQGSLHQR